MSDVYMDDFTGADDLESGRKLQEQLVSLLRGAGMELHKWSASNPLLLADSMCQDKDLSYSSSTKTKTLGLLWKPHPDSFAFKISPVTSNCDSLIVTKKSVISTIAKIFDPLGLIGPVITRAKISLQSLWQLKLDWNYPLPSNLVSYCKSFIDALESINCLNIPRYSLQELKETSDIPLCALLKTFEPLDIISNCSSFTKLQRVIAWSAEATSANIRNSFGYHPQGM
ncbi:integrase catalytic domain-containing protein [Trichonephila clavata]|uniref:Integrase catalytic domain-containing protein n=1 Tax=Trichonephila clavata TaxID=2740835 RepID=A0A8X6KVN6_TRICU|nr:integrase catalytic domain-containing protein [Trichonephila clavata]